MFRYAVADDYAFRRRGLAFEQVAYELRRIMNAVHHAEYLVVKKTVNVVIHRAAVFQHNVARKILRLTVESGGYGFIQFARHSYGRFCERERQHAVHDVGALHGGAHRALVGFGERHAHVADISVERSETAGGANEISLLAQFIFVAAQYVHGVPLGAQTADQVHRRHGSAVVLFSENVADNSYPQNRISPIFRGLDIKEQTFRTFCGRAPKTYAPPL